MKTKTDNVRINITVRRVVKPFLQRKSNITYCECVRSRSYPVSKQHAPYYTVICDLSSFYLILPHYLINVMIFGGGGVADYKIRVSILSTNLSETFFILNPPDTVLYAHWPSCKVPIILVRL